MWECCRPGREGPSRPQRSGGRVQKKAAGLWVEKTGGNALSGGFEVWRRILVESWSLRRALAGRLWLFAENFLLPDPSLVHSVFSPGLFLEHRTCQYRQFCHISSHNTDIPWVMRKEAKACSRIYILQNAKPALAICIMQSFPNNLDLKLKLHLLHLPSFQRLPSAPGIPFRSPYSGSRDAPRRLCSSWSRANRSPPHLPVTSLCQSCPGMLILIR